MLKFKHQRLPLFNQKGSLSIDAVISLSLALFVVLTAIGWYAYMTPRQGLEKQIHVIAQKAKIQGGLTATPALISAASTGFGELSATDLTTDVGTFLKILKDMGHDISKVKITCKTATGDTSCLGVDAYNSNGTNYIKRKNMEIMMIRVEIPAKSGLLMISQGFFGNIGALPEKYIFSESVMSERW